MTTKRIELPRIHLREISRSESLYMTCVVFLWGTWNIMAVCAYAFLSYMGIAEWIGIGVALSIVGSSFALVYIFLVIVHDHIWRRHK